MPGHFQNNCVQFCCIFSSAGSNQTVGSLVGNRHAASQGRIQDLRITYVNDVISSIRELDDMMIVTKMQIKITLQSLKHERSPSKIK